MKVDKKLCTPAMLYFVVSVVTILIALFSGVKFIALAMKAVFVIIWTFLLNLLCNKGYKSISWFLVLFPYVVMLLAFFMTSFKEGLDPTLDELTNKYFNEMKAGAVAQNKGKPLPAPVETSIMSAAKARAAAEFKNKLPLPPPPTPPPIPITTTPRPYPIVTPPPIPLPTITTYKPAFPSALAGLKGAVK